MTRRAKGITSGTLVGLIGLSWGVVDVVKEYQYRERIKWEYMAAIHKAHDTGKYVEECLPSDWEKK
jgi:hypothetical protein